MALFKLVDLGSNPEKQDLIAKEINYIYRPDKQVRFRGGYNVFMSQNVSEIITQFYAVRAVYGKYHGIQIRHFVLSFSSEYDNVTPYQAWWIGYEICALFRANYQIVFAVHEETDNLHLHFILNTVDLYTGQPFDCGKATVRSLHQLVGDILSMPGLWCGRKSVRLMG